MPVIKIVSLYAESHLPKKGWLQGCIMCEIITSHTRLAKVINNFDFSFLAETSSDKIKEEKIKIYKEIINKSK